MLKKPARRLFNPKSIDDLRTFKKFLQESKWDGACPFDIEFPHTTIPYMIKDKIMDTYLDKIIQDVEKQGA